MFFAIPYLKKKRILSTVGHKQTTWQGPQGQTQTRITDSTGSTPSDSVTERAL
ncbi:hypothetical protein [Halochromatium sp.]